VHNPLWSPDGKHVLYQEMNGGKLVTQTVGGMRKVEIIAEGKDAGPPESWSTGGNLLVYTLHGQTSGDDLWVRVVDGSSTPEPFLVTEYNENRAAISSDGKWIAYMSDETGSPEVFVRSYPDSGAAWQVSINGGRDPLWSRDGKELFFVSGKKMMAVVVEPGDMFAAGRPVELFEGLVGSTRMRDYDVAPDGRFITVRNPDGDDGQQELRMLLSWQQVMQRTAAGRH